MASRAGFNQRSELKRLADPRQFVDLRLVLHIAKGSSLGKVKVLDCGEHSGTSAYNPRISEMPARAADNMFSVRGRERSV
jgi:hypothetical protein